MKKRLVLSMAFIVSLLPMLMNQYGGLKGVQEVTGLINLFNPIGIISVLLFAMGVWMPLKKQAINKLLAALGTIGIVTSEIYTFFNWHVLTITGEINLQHSIRFAFPEFYVGLLVSITMVIFYFVIENRMGDMPEKIVLTD